MAPDTRLALLSVLRSILITAGTTLVSHGYVTQAVLNEAAGALIVIVAAAWGAIDKLKDPTV
jgi:hypothetical protein